MGRRIRDYKVKINQARMQLYRVNLVLDVIEAAHDFRHKPSYWNMRKLLTRVKRLNRVM